MFMFIYYVTGLVVFRCTLIKNCILESYDAKIPEKAKELLLTQTGEKA